MPTAFGGSPLCLSQDGYERKLFFTTFWLSNSRE